jgi:hypothetical protein
LVNSPIFTFNGGNQTDRTRFELQRKKFLVKISILPMPDAKWLSL